MKSFSQWTIDEVEKEFELIQDVDSEKLATWLSYAIETPESHHQKLQTLRTLNATEGYSWNEVELMMNFVGPLIDLIDYRSTSLKTFYTRTISAPVGNETLSGVVDFVLANGKRVPEKPIFFLHEYKKQYESKHDPLGQLVISMVAAQLINQDENPLYGVYIIGRYWHFVVLDGKEYADHPGLNGATEIHRIYQALQYVKKRIGELAG
ncbi:MAG: hypothetical protein AAF639_26405 [Chloroflexota bacterium]